MLIMNTGRYALAFTVTENGRERRIEFDRRRRFLDTGNIATEGITEITDEQYEKLKGNKLFQKQFDDGFFTKVDESELSAEADKLKAKDDEIARLKKELKESKKETSKKELEAKDKEISDLKAKLEAMSKKSEGASSEDTETEGF